MKPLATNHRVLTWLGLCPAPENISQWKKLSYIFFTVTILFLEILALISSIAYFMTFMRTDQEKSLYSLFQVFAFSSVVYVTIAMFFLHRELSDIFRKLTELYKIYENEDSFRFLAQANNNSEWMWMVYFKFAMTTVPVSVFSMAIASFLLSWLVVGKLDANYFAYPYKLILPWDQQSILGYFGEIFVTSAFGEAYMIWNGLLLLLFVSLCLHHQAFYQIFRYSISKLDRSDKKRDDQKLLGDLVDFHNSVKDLFLVSAEIYSPIVMVQLVCSMLMLTTGIFQLDLLEEISRIDVLLTMTMLISVALTNLFLLCFFGKLATESFEKMADCLFNSNWQNLPIRLQKHLIPMIANAQRPIYYHGFNMAVLDLRTFSSFLRKTFTYFMMLRTITE